MDGTSIAKPDLVMIRHFYFDKEKQQWTYWIRNIGLGDFTGEVGIAIESPTGQITRQTSEKYDADPVGFLTFSRIHSMLQLLQALDISCIPITAM